MQELSPTLKVAWHPNATPGVTYTVKYSTQAGKVNEPPEGASKVEGIMGTSTTLTELEQDKNYYIWVVAVSDDVEGPHSDRMTGTTCELDGNIINCSIILCYLFTTEDLYHCPYCDFWVSDTTEILLIMYMHLVNVKSMRKE